MSLGPYDVVRDKRDQTVASLYLGVRCEMKLIHDDALTDADQELFAEAFEQAAEAAKRVLQDRPEFLVEVA